MENNNELTAERSLEIIKRQIEQSRKDTEENMGTSLIIWGGMVFVTSLIVWYLWDLTGNGAWGFLWFAMAFIGWMLMIWQDKKNKHKHTPKTIITQMMSNIWFAFGIFASTFPILMFVVAPLLFGKFAMGYGITSIITLLLGMSTTITGLLVKNGWITAGGIIGGLAGAASAMLIQGHDEMLVMAGVSLVSLVIPGIIINWRTKHV